MKRILVSLFILVTIFSCEKNVATESQRNAENCMKEAMIEAQNWLQTLNEIGYNVLADQKYPSPFDKIMAENSKKDHIQKGIERMEQQFGKVKERKFFGVHILLEGKLLTYVPEKMKGFKQISPRRLRIKKIEDIYKDNVEGTYALLMYESKPTKKQKAEELIAMWRDKNDKWWFVGYEIADEI